MPIVSLYFLALSLVGALFFRMAGSARRRSWVLLCLNIIFVSSYMQTALDYLSLAGFILLGFLCFRAVAAHRTRTVLVGSLLVVIACFVYLKNYSVIGLLPIPALPVATVGMSYLLFRIITLLIGAHRGQISGTNSPLQLVNYSCLFLSFLSGPIQDFRDYKQQEENLQFGPTNDEDFASIFSRMVNGYIKIVIIGAVLQDLYLKFDGSLMRHPESWTAPIALAGATLFYLLYLYINFSGYMDVVIGAGRLYGFTLPENFRWPLSSSSFLEFWQRWHITLSNWFKAYVFEPLMLSATRRWSDFSPSSGLYIGVLAYFVTFLLMGIWHGSTVIFVVYGVFLGAGVSLNKLYQVEMRKLIGKKRFRNLGTNVTYNRLASALTVTYFAFSLICIWKDGSILWDFIRNMGPSRLALSFLVCFLLVLFAGHAWRILSVIYVHLKMIIGNYPEAYWATHASLAARLFVLSYFLVERFTTAPGIVYQVY